MAMNIGPSGGGDPEVMTEINTTPLIDVMLVLLIMLIITIPVQLHSVNLNLPIPQASPPPPSTPPEIVRIDVDFDGTVLWNGETVPTRDALEARLRTIAAKPVQPEVHLRPNKLAEYASVAAVLASAQRLGVTKLGVVGNEQFVN